MSLKSSALFLIYIWTFKATLSDKITVPNLNGYCYSQKGDVNIGVLVSISERGDDGELCSEQLLSHRRPQSAEIVKYAVNEVNSNVDILPNISLGYTIADMCSWDIVGLARSLRFIHTSDEGKQWANGTQALTELPTSYKCADVQQVEVAGILGPRTSRESVMVSSLMSLFKIPVLAPYSTSDELSDKARYEYFMRLVPPDSYQAQAIADLCVRYGWTYISLLYSEGSYGENGEKQIVKEMNKNGICIAYVEKIPSDASDEFYEHITNKLIANYKARVVVAFLDENHGRRLFKIITPTGLQNYFVWIGSDSIGALQEVPIGVLSMHFTVDIYQPFSQYYKYLTPFNSSNNIWMYRLWKEFFGCESWSLKNDSCNQFGNVTRPNQDILALISKLFDGVWVYAYALDNLIKENCPLAFTNQSLLNDCITGPSLLEYMKNVTFDGATGRMKFDQNGDMIGAYDILQFAKTSDSSSKFIKVGFWSKDTSELVIDEERIQYATVRRSMYEKDTVTGIPKSVCSEQCLPKQYRHQKELPCCWECLYCRENEVIINGSKCGQCERFTWPDDQTATKCEDINPSYLKMGEPLAISLIALNIFIIACFVFMVVLFHINRDVKLIKASSRELTTITSIGIGCALLAVFTFIVKPTTVACNLSYFGFHLSVSLIYAPLMLKTNRVYRIFASGKTGTRVLKWISKSSQVTLSFVLILAQVLICIVTVIIVRPVAKLRMQVPTEKHVELFCDLPLEGLLIPLAYNLALIILCALYGFLTRKLPENFNESWYIFISVSTTAFLWVVFLPTYFTTFYAYHQAAILAFCLIVNVTVTLLCLYFPKIYAIYFVSEDRLMIATIMETQNTVGPSVSTQETSGPQTIQVKSINN